MKLNKQNQDLQALGSRLNGLEASNRVQDIALVQAFRQELQIHEIEGEKDTLLQTKISENQRVLLSQLSLYLNQTIRTSKQKLVQTELDALIIKTMQNIIGVPLI